jgi:hypothetical protein
MFLTSYEEMFEVLKRLFQSPQVLAAGQGIISIADSLSLGT